MNSDEKKALAARFVQGHEREGGALQEIAAEAGIDATTLRDMRKEDAEFKILVDDARAAADHLATAEQAGEPADG